MYFSEGSISLTPLSAFFKTIYFLFIRGKVVPTHCVHPPPFCRGGGGVEPQTKFSKRRSLTGPHLLEGGCWETGGDFFQGGLQLSHKK